MQAPAIPPIEALPLGKAPPAFDPRTLRMGNYLDLAALSIPTECDYQTALAVLGAMLNDKLGCCTISACGHAVQVWSQAEDGAEVTVPDAAIESAYTDVSGYNPQTGANDNGAVVLDVLNYWVKTGVGGHRLGAFAKADPTNQQHLQACTSLFGGGYYGVGLPLTAYDQLHAGQVWDVPPGGQTGRGAPWSWGGHAIFSGRYTAQGVEFLSWGMRVFATWRFVAVYCDEAYATLGPEWTDGGARPAPSGFNLAQLQADLALIPGQAPLATTDNYQPLYDWLTGAGYPEGAVAYTARTHDHAYLKVIGQTIDGWVAYYGTQTPLLSVIDRIMGRRHRPPGLPVIPSKTALGRLAAIGVSPGLPQIPA